MNFFAMSLFLGALILTALAVLAVEVFVRGKRIAQLKQDVHFERVIKDRYKATRDASEQRETELYAQIERLHSELNMDARARARFFLESDRSFEYVERQRRRREQHAIMLGQRVDAPGRHAREPQITVHVTADTSKFKTALREAQEELARLAQAPYVYRR